MTFDLTARGAPMDDQRRRDDGMAQRRKVLGDVWVDKSIANQNSFNTEFVDLITRHAWADIWTRPHFDHRTRRILVIGTLVALGQWDEFRLHVRAALTEGGFSPDDIKEILLLLAGPLAAALLLAGLLTRVLILLTRVLVLVRHGVSLSLL